MKSKILISTGQRVDWEGNGTYRWNETSRVWEKMTDQQQREWINDIYRIGTTRSIFDYEVK